MNFSFRAQPPRKNNMDSRSKDSKSKQLGKEGERIACELLKARGFFVLDKNVHCGHKEIDIICIDGADLRFVEVKTRREPVQGDPTEAVNALKQKRIGAAASAFLASEEWLSTGMRADECHFDVVTVVFDRSGTSYETEYIPDAYFLIYT